MAKTKTPGSKKPTQKPDDEDTEGQEGAEDKDDDAGDDGEDENRRINAIVTSRVKRAMKDVDAKLAGLMAKLESMSTPKKDDEDDEDDEGDGDGKKPVESKPDPKLARKLQKMENELKEERDARKKAEMAQKDEQEKSKRTEMLSSFDAALNEHGVTDPKLRRAALRLLEEDGFMVRDDESGKVKFKGQDKYGMEVTLDPKVGVKQWVLNEGKSFIPAVDAGGSGTGGARQGLGNTNITKGEYGKLSPQQKAAIELERASAGLPALE